MVSKKQKIKIKKRRSIGGAKPGGFMSTAVRGIGVPSQNPGQRPLTIQQLGNKTQSEVGTAIWKGVLTGERPNFTKVGTALKKRATDLTKTTEKVITMVGQAGIPTSGIKSSLSSATTSVSGLAKSATTAGSTLAKSATTSFSSLANGASKELKINSSCVIL
jgi:hypothetical protein